MGQLSPKPLRKRLILLDSPAPLGSATSFAQSFTFKALAARLCKWGAMFV